MKVKYKLFFSLLFLFGVIILLGSFGSYYLRWLAKDSAAIMQDNYRTLMYLRDIEHQLDELQLKVLDKAFSEAEAQQIFDPIKQAIRLQHVNVTESGEKKLTKELSDNLEKLEGLYLAGASSTAATNDQILAMIYQIKIQTGSIYSINEETMLHKNELAGTTASNAVLYMNIFTGASILVALVFIIALPIYISRPLKTFAVAIKEISKGNYKVNIPLHSKDEYGKLAGLFNLMAAKLDKFEDSNLAKLINEQKRLNAVINHMDEAILGLDECKKVIFANDHCLKLLSLDRDQIMGEYAPKLAADNQLMESLIQELMIDFMPFEEKIYPPVTIIDNHKERLFAKNIINVVGRLEEDKKEGLMGHVIVLTDITDFTEKDKAKTHFIATLSHELKTPVSAILMSTNLLRNTKTGSLAPSQVELVETIENNSERIRRMINEVLDISKIESGTIDVNLTVESPDNLIDKAVEGVSLFLKDKGLEITHLSEANLPAVTVDAHKLVWVLNNLLTNAIRYAPEGSTIQLKTAQKGKFLEIGVIDQGQGIAVENQKKIFRKFSRLKNSDDSGTGLGLAISKEFIEAMGGSIGVESEEGKGASFWIRLNLAS
ncbi:HAMP domain-containing histidine kinase [Algoriphagus resistens]|uniref:HAMP domain-containing histidine kinase n=1 Tax=Algoriphagus resistens TaxID=1750590 RepID=UPI000716A79E|nr:HAMP domain-containing histidine kinase [Algoriphagus resistens]